MKKVKGKRTDPENTYQYWIDMAKNRESEEQFLVREANTKKIVKKLCKKIFK